VKDIRTTKYSSTGIEKTNTFSSRFSSSFVDVYMVYKFSGTYRDLFNSILAINSLTFFVIFFSMVVHC